MVEKALSRWQGSGVMTRVATALVLAPLAITGVLYLPTEWFTLLFGGVLCFALWEWTRVIGFRRRRLRTVVVLANAGIMLWLWWAEPTSMLMPIVWAGAAWWCLAIVWLRAFEFAQEPTLRNLELKVLVGSMMVVPTFVAAWLTHRDPSNGPWWILFVLVLIWVADSAAYFAGRQFGQHKLAPRISPGKTLEGVAGALIGSAIFAAVAGLLLPAIPIAHGWLIVLALVTVLFSIVGDLFESLIKRQSKVKDSGNLLPGHGGMLDRIDSVLAALPIFVCGRTLIGL
jgi:phosphatidate cytidylyltransferase